MKIAAKTEPRGFRPITVTMIIESQEELDGFRMMDVANISGVGVRQGMIIEGFLSLLARRVRMAVEEAA